MYEPDVVHGEACWSLHMNTSTFEGDVSMHFSCGNNHVIETLS